MTTIASGPWAQAFFAAHGDEWIHRVVIDNGANYRPGDFTRTVQALAVLHQRIRPYTPRHNSNVERFYRLLADGALYSRPYPTKQARPIAIGMCEYHFDYPRPHAGRGDQHPASRTSAHANNVMPFYA